MGMLQVALSKSASTDNKGRMFFTRGDCHRLPFARDSFDVVTIQGMLHHHGSVNWKTALGETARVLAPGGRLYISEPCAESNPAGRLLAYLVTVLIRLKRLLCKPGKLFDRKSTQLDVQAPHTEERPVEGRIVAREVVAELRRLGFDVHTRFLTEIPATVSLSEKTAAQLIRVVSAPLGSNFGDIVFIYARKTRPAG